MMHYLLSSSGSERWVSCTPSLLMEAMYPDVPTEEAEEGTSAHWVMEVVLNDRIVGNDKSNCHSMIGRKAPNGVVVTDEMADGAQVFVDHVIAVAKSHDAVGQLEVEVRGSAPNRIHPLQGGTADARLRVGNKLYLFDFKFGHVPVEVVRCRQLICYYAHALEHFGINGLEDQHLQVQFCIVQPRAHHRDGIIRTWDTVGADLRAELNYMATRAPAAVAGQGKCETGKHCLHCKAAGTCPTLSAAGGWAVALSGESGNVNMTAYEEAYELATLEAAYTVLKARLTARRESITSKLENGTPVDGWSLEREKGRIKFDPEQENTVIAIGKAFNVDVTKRTLKTVNQVKNLGIDMEILKPYTVTQPGKLSLIQSEKTLAYKAFNTKG